MPQQTTLTPAQIDTIKDVAWQTGVEIDSTYSGRYMYGATCFGIVGDINSYTQFVFRLVNDDHDLAFILADHILSMDSMGHDTIYYWTGIAGFPEDEDDDEDDE